MGKHVAALTAGLCCIVIAGCGGVGVAPTAAVKPPVAVGVRVADRLSPPPCAGSVRSLGIVAVAARGRVEVVDLATCRITVLAGVTAGEVSFSPDGRWLAYSRQQRVHAGDTSSGPSVVSIRGGPARAPLGPGVVAWSWGPRGELLYGVTRTGLLVSASPTGGRRVIAAQLGAGRPGPSGLSVSPAGGRAVVDRSRCGPPAVGELDAIDLRTGARSVVLRRTGSFVTFAGFSPTGRWLLFWTQGQCSASLAADGMRLDAVPAAGGTPVGAVGNVLPYRDFVTWCGGHLVAAAGPDRETNTGGRLVQSAPAAWRQRTIRPAGPLSWVSPSCAPSGRPLVAAAGPNGAPVSFGQEHRSIWLLHPNGDPIRRLTSPPAPGLSDEAPRFSADGRWILFVRTRLVGNGSQDTIELTPTNGTGGAIPIVSFASGDLSYYDHFDWPDEVAWSPGRG